MKEIVWTSTELTEALGKLLKTKIAPSTEHGIVEFNSKDVKHGDLFIALSGEKRDGHEFVHDAIKNGASAAIVANTALQNEKYNLGAVQKNKLIIVDDCMSALQEMANYKRSKIGAKYIAITGSVGKTSTKEAFGLAFSALGKSFTSRANFNNKLGVLLNLASMPNDVEFAIIETGMSAPGELAELSQIVKPDIAVLTNVSEGHIGFFDNIGQVADAKCEIFQGLDADTGYAIINSDFATYQRCCKNLDNLGIKNIITYGKNEDADFIFTSHEIVQNEAGQNSSLLTFECINTGLSEQPDQPQQEINPPNCETVNLYMPQIQEHLATNFGACFAAIHAMQILQNTEYDLSLAASALTKFSASKGRGALVTASKGKKTYDIICDYYNSAPESLKAALINLKQFENQKKMIIISSLAELGEFEEQIHQDMLKYIEAAGAEHIFLIGEAMQKIASKIRGKNCFIKWFSSAEDILQEIDNFTENNQIILIKGSRKYSLEKIATHLGVENAL